MRQEPDLSDIAALIGEPSRAAMLAALLDGRALPAGELAYAAGAISAQAASMHLAKLVAGGLLSVEREGRHRYYRLAHAGVAEALEALAGLTPKPLLPPLSPAAARLRYARSCYDHLAGEIGVAVMQALMKQGLIRREEEKRVSVTPSGIRWFHELGIEVAQLRPGRHGIARACLDWTQRRHHLAGPLGARLFERLIELEWLRRERRSRIVRVTPAGQRRLASLLGVTSNARTASAQNR